MEIIASTLCSQIGHKNLDVVKLRVFLSERGRRFSLYLKSPGPSFE